MKDRSYFLTFFTAISSISIFTITAITSLKIDTGSFVLAWIVFTLIYICKKRNRNENVAEFGYDETPRSDHHGPFYLVSLNYGVAEQLAVSSVLCKTLEVKYFNVFFLAYLQISFFI